MSNATKTLAIQVTGSLVVLVLTAAVGWGLGANREAAEMHSNLTNLSSQVDEVKERQRAVEAEIKILYEMRGSITGLTEEVRGLREDLRSLRTSIK